MTEARETKPAFEAEPAKAAPVTLAGDAAPRVVPYGSWRSPIMAEMVARAALRRGATCTGLFCLLGGGAPAGGRRNVIVRRNADGTVGHISRPVVYQFGRRIVQSIYCPRLRSGPTLPIHKLGTRLIGDRLHEHFLFCRSFVSAAEFIENSSALGKNGAYDDKATSDRILRVLTRDEDSGFPPEEQLTAYSRVKETT